MPLYQEYSSFYQAAFRQIYKIYHYVEVYVLESGVCKGSCASKLKKIKNEGGNVGLSSILCHHAQYF